MFFLYLLIALLISANLHTFINEYRFNLGIMPINLFEICSALVVLSCLFTQFLKRQPIDPQRRNFIWLVIVFYFFATIGPVLVGLFHNVEAYILIQALRNFVALPFGVILGYWAVKNLDQVRRIVKWIALLSVPLCIFTLAAVVKGTEAFHATDQENALRTISYLSSSGGIVTAFMIYSAGINRRFFSRTISLIIISAAFIACFAPLSKSLWIPLFLSMFSVVFMTPKGLRIHSWRALSTAGTWVFCSLLIGFLVAWLVLRIDMIEIVNRRIESLFVKLDNPEGAYFSRWVGLKGELVFWLESSIVFGSGFGQSKTIELVYGVEGALGHCAYSYTLSQAGLLGITALLLSVWIGIHIGREMARSINPNVRAAGILILCAGIFLGLESLLTGSLNSNRTGLFYGLVLGMAIKCYRFQVEPEPYYDEYLEYEDLANESNSEPSYEEIYY